MKLIVLLLSCFLLSFTLNAQSPKISIQTTPPTQLKAGQSFILKVKVQHNLKEEKTGNLTLTLFNNETKKEVDGWFINVFPFQYFTTILNTPFETEFPFTVPDAFTGKFDIVLVAEVNQLKDSIRFTVPTRKK